jgi:hypothetical protein
MLILLPKKKKHEWEGQRDARLMTSDVRSSKTRALEEADTSQWESNEGKKPEFCATDLSCAASLAGRFSSMCF